MKNIRIRTGKRKFYDEPDEFMSFAQKVRYYVQENTNQAYIALGAVALVIVLTILVSLMMDVRQKKIFAMQSEALKYYDAQSPAPGGRPLTEPQRYEKADGLFAEIAEEYGGSGSGRLAMLYKANADHKLGRLDEAIEGYKRLYEGGSDQVLRAVAGISLASAYTEKGDREAAVAVLSRHVENLGYLKDEAMFMLGWLYELMDRQPEALSVYMKLAGEYPASVRAGEAQARGSAIRAAQDKARTAQPAAPATN